MTLPAVTTTTQQLSPPPPPLHFHNSNRTQSTFPYLSQNPTTNNNNPSKHHIITLKHSNSKPSFEVETTATWTSKIAHHCRNGRLAKAAKLFTQMRLSGVQPNHITFVTLLSCCANFPSQTPCFGASLHGFGRKMGLDINNVMVGTATVDMYSKLGRVDLAGFMFDQMNVKNIVSWNTLINGCMRNGEIAKAVELFDEIPERDVVSWTALIGGFVNKGYFEQSLLWFREMQLSRVEPDYVAIVCVLSACANLGMLGLGLWIHRYVLMKEFNRSIRVNNSLIDMYSRCGCVELAHQVFKSMGNRSLVSWNSIIVGCAINGHAEETLEYFNLMVKDGFKPDGVSFTGALTACSHVGFVEKGLKFFDIMKTVYRISPRIEHYGCLVDLYSRAGRLEDALDVIQNMPMKPNEVVLGSLLAACRTRKDVILAERLMEYIKQLDPGGDSNYVLLSNIYATVGSWHGAGTVRRKMKALGIQKKPGISSIGIDCITHEFVAGDKSHFNTQHIYAMLELLSLELRISGYIPESDVREAYEYDCKFSVPTPIREHK